MASNKYIYIEVLPIHLQGINMYPIQPTPTLGSRLLKHLTIGLFLILPARVSKIFISLSMLSLIYHIRDESYQKTIIDDSKLRTLLNCSFDNEMMKLPSYTVHWFWSEGFLTEKVKIRGQELTIEEAISNDEIFHRNYKTIIDTLLSNTPKGLYHKLGLSKNKNRLLYKQSLFRLV